jgi:hypothetical protein
VAQGPGGLFAPTHRAGRGQRLPSRYTTPGQRRLGRTILGRPESTRCPMPRARRAGRVLPRPGRAGRCQRERGLGRQRAAGTGRGGRAADACRGAERFPFGWLTSERGKGPGWGGHLGGNCTESPAWCKSRGALRQQIGSGGSRQGGQV